MHFLQHRDLAGPNVFPANPITNLDRIDGIVHVEEDDYRSPLNGLSFFQNHILHNFRVHFLIELIHLLINKN